MSILAICVIAVVPGVLVNAADVYRASARDIKKTAHDPPVINSVMNQQQTNTDPDSLEHDLEVIKENKGHNVITNSQESLTGAPQKPNSMYDSTAVTNEDDIDLQLLYDLIHAIEYEANMELFESVLQDLDKATFGKTGPAQELQTPGKVIGIQSQAMPESEDSNIVSSPDISGSEAQLDARLELQNAANIAASAADTHDVKLAGDKNGWVAAQGMPLNARAPLHKRISNVLRDAPLRPEALFPQDGLAVKEKKNVL